MRAIGPSYLQEQLGAEQEGEDQFVMSEKRPADVFIQAELEVVLQVAQSSVQDFGLVTENTHVSQYHVHPYNFNFKVAV